MVSFGPRVFNPDRPAHGRGGRFFLPCRGLRGLRKAIRPSLAALYETLRSSGEAAAPNLKVWINELTSQTTSLPA